MGITEGGIRAAETRNAIVAFYSPVFATEISSEESADEEYRKQLEEEGANEEYRRQLEGEDMYLSLIHI